MVRLAATGIRHLLVDFPSIDRMHDGGRLTNHHLFWNVPERYPGRDAPPPARASTSSTPSTPSMTPTSPASATRGRTSPSERAQGALAPPAPESRPEDRSAHRAVPPSPPRTDRTVTEMIYVPDRIADGRYVLNLQLPAFQSDAAPSRPIIYPLEEI